MKVIVMLEKVTYRDVFRFTRHYWGAQRGMLAGVFAMMALAAVLDTLFPIVAGRLIDVIGSASTPGIGLADAVLPVFLLFVALEATYHTVRNGSIFLWNRVANLALYSIVTEAYAKVQRFSTDWHANNFAGGTVRKITRGMWSFDVFEDILFMYLFPTSVVLVSTVVLMTLHWPVMGLVTFIAAAVYVGFSLWSVLVVNAPRFRRSAAEDTRVGAALADAVTGNAAIKAFGMERIEDFRFNRIAAGWRTLALNSWQIANSMDLIRRYIAVGMMVAMIGTALWLWEQGRADAGDVVYVFTAFMVLTAYLRHIGEQISNLQKAVSEMEDIVYFWKTGIAVEDAPDARPFMPGRGDIVFDHVRFVYKGQASAVYDDFSIHISPGERVALVGPSGAGKSTFVKLVQRLYDVQGGEIRIDGQNVAKVTQESLRKAIALVPQDPILFHRSLAENIGYGRPGADMDEIVEAAKKAYAHDFIMSLPQTYETLVGERGVKLSGGERQRVAIARAILTDAPILILDEATSSLDSVSEHYIQKALAELVRGRTTITIAHRLATIKSVDRILVFDRGRIVEQGTHAELIARPGSHYRGLYEMQALDLVGPEGLDAKTRME